MNRKEMLDFINKQMSTPWYTHYIEDKKNIQEKRIYPDDFIKKVEYHQLEEHIRDFLLEKEDSVLRDLYHGNRVTIIEFSLQLQFANGWNKFEFTSRIIFTLSDDCSKVYKDFIEQMVIQIVNSCEGYFEIDPDTNTSLFNVDRFTTSFSHNVLV